MTVVATVWRGVPLLAVLLLAALRTVPPVLGRAARMDGASSFQSFRYTTLPAIMPTLVVVSILQVILSLQVFDVLFAITRGRPLPGGSLMGYGIFDTVINDLSLGYGAALTVVLGIAIAICLGLLAVVFRRLRTASGDSDTAGRPPADPDDDIADGGRHRPSLPSTPAPAGARGLRYESDAVETRRRVRGPGVAWAWKVARVLVVAVLAIWFVGPIVWIAIASTQPESRVEGGPAGADASRSPSTDSRGT